MECEDLNESIERAYIRIKIYLKLLTKFLFVIFLPYVDYTQKGAQHFNIENLLSFCIKIYLED